ncbi:restriction endonuclease-like protein [Acidithiobacillus ferrooxidans]|uniref:restriction endonuclease-like protein n=1 Tax=Acidithiobacillus ferrooxidans TaxID=920 RepID=UPI00214A955F|nr:restriction endonuclease-like protein [Acidithiobacillus ferrooxidans]
MTALYIQAEGSGPASQVWPVPDTVPPGAVREGASYLFELRDSGDALAADLLIDDAPVEALRSREPRNAKWRWQPGFHAGVVEAVLRVPGIGTRRFEVTTDPDLRKLTRGDFDAMVREVLEDTFALFSLSAFRKGIARQPSNRPPPLARLEFLRSRANAIVTSVEAIARAPRHYLRAEDITVPAHRATRATGPEIVKSFRSGVIRTETVTPSRLPAALKGRLPAQITLRQRRNSVDIPEHRQIKACLRSWAAWLGGVADLLAKADSTNDPEIITTAGSWAVRTRRIARRLNDVSATGFMTDVSDGPALLRMSSLFRNDPVYQRIYRLWQDMNLGLAALFGDFLQMPLARTYELYELWCFLRLLRAAVEEYGATGVDLSNLFLTEASGGVTIAAGAITVPIGGDRVLCFQRQYREYWVEDSREGSFSRTMIPDVVLAGRNLGGPERRVIVLDAKYRINDGLNDALNSIHTYRDALVQEVASGRTEGIVTAAYLLTPHVPAGLHSDFKATPVPGRLFHPEYREKFRFGAVTLRPGMLGEELRTCLRTIVADAGAGA